VFFLCVGGEDRTANIGEGFPAFAALLDNNETMSKLRAASSREEVVALL
ncbi:hypothetical protein M8371_32070, partial [Klebsiella pneumoniae]|nr:hypothetical protein [Klebsiella pneumoniae]